MGLKYFKYRVHWHCFKYTGNLVQYLPQGLCWDWVSIYAAASMSWCTNVHSVGLQAMQLSLGLFTHVKHWIMFWGIWLLSQLIQWLNSHLVHLYTYTILRTHRQLSLCTCINDIWIFICTMIRIFIVVWNGL